MAFRRAPRTALVAGLMLLPALARADGRVCLSSGDTAEAVASHAVLAPDKAIVLARHAVPNADILRALLCRETEELVYRITALRHDGRLVRVTLDAPSGKVKSIR